MHFQKLLKSVRSEIYFTLVVAVAAAAIGSQSAKFFPSGYNLSQTFIVTPPQDDQSAYYQQEMARNFTDTIVALAQESEFAKDILPGTVSMSARKLGPQIVRITLQSPSAQDLPATISKVAPAINTKVQALYQTTKVNQLQEASPPTPVSYFALNKITLALAGLLAGLLFSILTIGLKFYFKL